MERGMRRGRAVAQEDVRIAWMASAPETMELDDVRRAVGERGVDPMEEAAWIARHVGDPTGVCIAMATSQEEGARAEPQVCLDRRLRGVQVVLRMRRLDEHRARGP